MAKHVIIVGAGVIGTCTAHYLLQRGYRVTLVDRAGEPDRGCSYGNAGMIVPSHFVPLAAPGMVWTAMRMMLNSRSPFYIKPRLDAELFDWGWKFWRASTRARVERAAPLLYALNTASRECYQELANQTGNELQLVRQGLLMLCNTEHGLADEIRMAEQAKQLGVPAEVLDAKQIASLEPQIRMNVTGGVRFSCDCHLSPDRLMASLRQSVRQAGGVFHWSSAVAGWRMTSAAIEAIRLTSGQEIGADEFIVAGGAWSAELTRELGLKIPMQPGKGYSLTLSHPRSMPRACAILTEARIAVTPMGQSLRFGGTMEMSGLNHVIRRERVRGITEAIPRYYPEYSASDFAEIEPWHGLRPCSPDGLPYIGRASRYSNLTIATGHAMMGISLAPITGTIVAQQLAGEKSAFDLTLLDPNRYDR